MLPNQALKPDSSAIRLYNKPTSEITKEKNDFLLFLPANRLTSTASFNDHLDLVFMAPLLTVGLSGNIIGRLLDYRRMRANSDLPKRLSLADQTTTIDRNSDYTKLTATPLLSASY